MLFNLGKLIRFFQNFFIKILRKTELNEIIQKVAEREFIFCYQNMNEAFNQDR